MSTSDSVTAAFVKHGEMLRTSARSAAKLPSLDATATSGSVATVVAIPTPPIYSASFRDVLDGIAKFLIRSVKISTLSVSFSICEVEMYAFAAGVYEDRFTHRDSQQEILGTFYFHKKGGTYKGGSFKGLDLTFGFEKVACGALIRSIREDKEGGRLVEGPSLVVDAILAAAGCKDISAIIKTGTGEGLGCLCVTEAVATKTGCSWSKSLGAIIAADVPEPPKRVLSAPRVGLIPRTADDLVYAGRLLRFIDGSCKLAKQRAGIIAAMLLEGKSRAVVRELTGGMPNNIDLIHKRLAEVKKNVSAVESTDDKNGGVLGGDVMQPTVIAGILAWAEERNCL